MNRCLKNILLLGAILFLITFAILQNSSTQSSSSHKENPKHFYNEIPEPSIPEFSVQPTSNPYFVPEVTFSLPEEAYSGPFGIRGDVKGIPAHINENKSILVTIKNQPFIQTEILDGVWAKLYYNVRWCLNSEKNYWSYSPINPTKSGYINASQSDYTVLNIPKPRLPATSNGSKLDFQVQALIGYDEQKYAVSDYTGVPHYTGNYFYGKSSDWSQSLTYVLWENESSSPSPTPSPTQAVPDFPFYVVIPIVLTIVLVGLIFCKKYVSGK